MYLYAWEKVIAIIACRVSKCQDAPDGPVGDSGPRMAYATWANGPPPPKKYAAYHTVWSETFIDTVCDRITPASTCQEAIQYLAKDGIATKL